MHAGFRFVLHIDLDFIFLGGASDRGFLLMRNLPHNMLEQWIFRVTATFLATSTFWSQPRHVAHTACRHGGRSGNHAEVQGINPQSNPFAEEYSICT